MREGNLWVNYEYFNVLVVTLCKPVVYKVKILMEENLNIINQWGKPQKREGASNLDISVGGSKGR